MVSGQTIAEENVALLTSTFGARQDRAREYREQGMSTFQAAMTAQEEVSLPSWQVTLPFEVQLPGGRTLKDIDLGVQGALELALDPWNVGIGLGAVTKLGRLGAQQVARVGAREITETAAQKAVTASPDVSLQFAKREVARLELLRQKRSGPMELKKWSQASRNAIDEKIRQERKKVATLEAQVAQAIPGARPGAVPAGGAVGIPRMPPGPGTPAGAADPTAAIMGRPGAVPQMTEVFMTPALKGRQRRGPWWTMLHRSERTKAEQMMRSADPAEVARGEQIYRDLLEEPSNYLRDQLHNAGFADAVVEPNFGVFFKTYEPSVRIRVTEAANQRDDLI